MDFSDYEVVLDRYGTTNVTTIPLDNSFSQTALKAVACFDHTVFLIKSGILVEKSETDQQITG